MICRRFLAYLAPLAALVVGALDCRLELGIATGVLYVGVVWLAYLSGSKNGVWWVAGACSVLVIVGTVASPFGGEPWKVMINRVLTLFAIWMTAFPSARAIALVAESSLRAQGAELLAHDLEDQHREDARKQRALLSIMEDLRSERATLGLRTEEVAAINRNLEHTNLELQQFAYAASHDLQTPLRTISGFAGFLAEEYQDAVDDRAKDYIRRIVEGVSRLQQLIHDLLTYSRIGNQGRPLEATGLNEICDGTVASLESLLDEVGGRVTRDELPVVRGDKAQLGQLLQNLIENSLKYRSEEAPHVHVSAEREPGTWSISVHDNGIGFDPKHKERIFEVFRRLHGQEQYPGTGIGLAVCRRIVQRHGGTIWVDSTPGQGSVFSFSVPLTKEESNESAARAPSRSTSR